MTYWGMANLSVGLFLIAILVCSSVLRAASYLNESRYLLTAMNVFVVYIL